MIHAWILLHKKMPRSLYAVRKGYDTNIEELLAHDLADPSDVWNEATIRAWRKKLESLEVS